MVSSLGARVEGGTPAPVPRAPRSAGSLVRSQLRAAAALLGGALLAVASPPRTLWWTAVLAFALLWVALRGTRARGAGLLGLLFGLAFFLPHLVWVEDFLGTQYGPAPWLALSALMALFTASACALVPLVSRLPGAPAWAALLLVLQETVRGQVPAGGFPWGRVAFGQVEGPFLPLAAVGGAPLVTFAVVATGFGLAAWATAPRELRRAWVVLLPVAALAASPLVGTEAQEGERTVALVQGNAPDVGLELLGQRDTLRRNHLRATAELADAVRAGEVPRPDLVVWPESATPTDDDDPVLDAAVADVGAPALIGAVRPVEGGDANVVVAWDPVTGPGQQYVKQELVPFGERIPFRSVASLVTPFVAAPDLVAGTEPGVLDVAGTRIGVGTCYEVAYDHVLRETAARGAQLLVVPTNNAWYGPGEMSYQQLAMARLRAVENGRAVVVAAVSGVSAVVRPDGSVERETGLFTEDVVVADVPLRSQTTLATRWGGAVQTALTAGALGTCAVALLLRRRRG